MSEASDENPEIVVGPREQLFHLIAEASEIEHTLMCSYLYAAFSLKRGTEEGLSETEAQAVARWREAIMSVAIDEMVHLLLVSNLAVAVGARPHFDRPNFPVESGYFPSGVVVKLTPFSLDTLDHFIFLERPQGYQLEDGDGFEPEREYDREQPYSGLMPSVQDYATVGRLYEALRVNLIACSRRLGEERLFANAVNAQIDRDLVDLEGVARVADLRTALAAIDVIVEQGEGSESDRDGSHYRRFTDIKTEYLRLREANPQFAPAWPAAESPVMRRPPTPEGKVFIDHPVAARVLDFANAVYGLLLRCLVQVFDSSLNDERREQSRFMSTAIELMHVFGMASHALVRLPATSESSQVNAGVTFTMLRSVAPLLGGTVGERLVHERLGELENAARSLGRVAPEFSPIPAKLVNLQASFQHAA